MHVMQQNKLAGLGLLSCSASLLLACSATAACDNELFRCQAQTPQALMLQVCQSGSQFSLQQFNLGGNTLQAASVLSSVTKEGYHRFKVDEHSLSFSYNGANLVLSDYFSAEFEPHEKILSVTLEQGGQKQYFECGDGSLSRLSSIKNSE